MQSVRMLSVAHQQNLVRMLGSKHLNIMTTETLAGRPYGQVIGDVNTEERKVSDSFSDSSVDVYGVMHLHLQLPVVHYHFLCFPGIKREVNAMTPF